MSKSSNKTNNSNNKIQQNDFISNLERASSTVKTWPEWKQNVWGPAISENRGCFLNNK